MNTDIKNNPDTPMSNAAIIYPHGDYYDDKVLLDDCRKIERMYNDIKFKYEQLLAKQNER